MPPKGKALSADVELRAYEAGYHMVAGIDEAGRGALAGPVVAAAVVMPLERRVEGVNDSKKLKPELRAELAAAIIGRCIAWGLGVVSSGEIDEINILQATHLAMRRALERLEPAADYAVVDGLPVPGLGVEGEAIVAGDAVCYSIAAASIVAKVQRDRIMEELGRQYPGYGLGEHKGYGTQEHCLALEELGPCPIHRLTFEPLRSRAQMRMDL